LSDSENSPFVVSSTPWAIYLSNDDIETGSKGVKAFYLRLTINVGPCGRVCILILFRVYASTNSYFTF